MHVPAATENADVGQAKAHSLSYVVLLAATTAISGFPFGFDIAVINGVLLLLRLQFALSNLQTEVAASSLLLGCLLGAAGASMIGDRYGRRKSLIASALLFAFSSVGTALANTVTLFSVARFGRSRDRSRLRAHAGVYCRDFAFKESRNARLVESIGDRSWHSLGISGELADRSTRREQLAVDVGRRSDSINCVSVWAASDSRESTLADQQRPPRSR